MKKMRRLADPILPHDFVIELLTILPAKSLMRFKCVSKLWHSTISDPSFVKWHRSRSLTRPDGSGFIISFPNNKITKQHFFSANLQDNSCHHQVTLSVDSILGYSITQVVNALVCVVDGNRVSVCNICTHEVLTLPVSSVNNVNVIHTTPQYYFGFDSLNDKYKLLNMCITICPDICFSDDGCEVYSSFVEWKILTVGADSWRKIDAASFKLDLPIRFNPHSIFIDRFIFWMNCIDELSLSRGVGAFDVIDEQFHIIPVPENVPKGVEPLQFGKHLALCFPVNPHKLWILLDPYKHTWVEKCICYPFDVFQRHYVLPAAQFRTDEVLLTPLKFSVPIQVLNYDVIKEHWTTIEIAAVPLSKFLCGYQPAGRLNITSYVENILPLPNHS